MRARLEGRARWMVAASVRRAPTPPGRLADRREPRWPRWADVTLGTLLATAVIAAAAGWASTQRNDASQTLREHLQALREQAVRQVALGRDRVRHDASAMVEAMGRLPVNPLNGSARVKLIGPDEHFPNRPQGNAGWIYQPSTARVVANVSGADDAGVAYFDY